jgi:hypothetical protein
MQGEKAPIIDSFDLDSLVDDSLIPIDHEDIAPDMVNDVIERAHVRGVVPAAIALEMGMPIATNPIWWREPTAVEENEADYRGLNLMGRSNNILTEFSKSIAKTMQFRLDSVYLHGLGVVSSAMIRNFRYLRFGIPKPPGLYTIASQPSGSGKSGVTSYLSNPIRKIVNDYNKTNKPKREEVKIRLDEKIKNRARKNVGTNERVALGDDIARIEEELKQVQEYVYGVTDATPEALEEKCVAINDGIFSVISDEAEAVTVLIGANYSEGQANLGVMLAGWEGGHQNSLRIGRGGYRGDIFGAISVLAQKSVIDSILSAGRSNAGGSRGAAERFLAISEPDNFDNMDAHSYTPIDENLRSIYHETMTNIFYQPDIKLEFCQRGQHELNTVKARLIGMVKTGGRYNDSFMQSVAIKGDVQVAKLASVLHALENWCPGGARSNIVSVDHIRQAEHTFMQCLKSFEIAADEQGVAGKKTEINALIKKFKAMANDKRYANRPVKSANFCDTVKGNAPFKGKAKVVSLIKGMLPDLEKLNYIVYDKASELIYINPMLRD